MNKGFSTKKELEKEFRELNKFLVENQVELELVVVGGSATILHEINIRVTHDIDYINKIKSRIIGLINESFPHLDINDKVQVAHHTPFFYN